MCLFKIFTVHVSQACYLSKDYSGLKIFDKSNHLKFSVLLKG